MRPSSALRSALYVAPLLLASCGDAGLVDPPEAPVIDSGSGVVGTKGGIVAVGATSSPAYGSMLIIPAGALTQPVEIKITAAPSSVSLPGDPAAVVVRFEPAGLRFQTAIALGLSYARRSGANPASLKIVHYDPATGATTDLPSVTVDAQSQILFAATDHFSHFALTTAGGTAFGTLDIAGKIYRTVAIGTQTWMADNMDRRAGSFYCGDGQTANCDAFGALYTWSTARTICPTGWRLPSDADWMTMERFLGVAEGFLDHPMAYRGGDVNAGGRLKAVSPLWRNSLGWANEGANNATGFSGLPSGYRHRENGSWTSPGELTYFWSSTENASDAADAWIRGLGLTSQGVYRSSIPKTHALPVRCVKN